MNKNLKGWLIEFCRDKLPLAIINALMLGLLATVITDSWESQRKRAELQLDMLKEFEDRSNKLIGCMLAPRAMERDRECLVVELDLLAMESAFGIIFDTPFNDDFSDLASVIAQAHQRTTKDGKWVLSDQAFDEFRIAFSARIQHMRQKILTERGDY